VTAPYLQKQKNEARRPPRPRFFVPSAKSKLEKASAFKFLEPEVHEKGGRVSQGESSGERVGRPNKADFPGLVLKFEDDCGGAELVDTAVDSLEQLECAERKVSEGKDLERRKVFRRRPIVRRREQIGAGSVGNIENGLKVHSACEEAPNVQHRLTGSATGVVARSLRINKVVLHNDTAVSVFKFQLIKLQR